MPLTRLTKRWDVAAMPSRSTLQTQSMNRRNTPKDFPASSNFTYENTAWGGNVRTVWVMLLPKRCLYSRQWWYSHRYSITELYHYDQEYNDHRDSDVNIKLSLYSRPWCYNFSLRFLGNKKFVSGYIEVSVEHKLSQVRNRSIYEPGPVYRFLILLRGRYCCTRYVPRYSIPPGWNNTGMTQHAWFSSWSPIIILSFFG